MFAAIAQSAPIAVGIIFSSIPLVAVTLALLTRPHKTAVLAFLLGWMAGITLVGSLVLLLADGSSRDAQATPGWLAWASRAPTLKLCRPQVRTPVKLPSSRVKPLLPPAE